ncbi:hypothetical protein M8J77_006743 [Diaphorina citri]|nr:hypothetical protein M8J77_006743 [Diaphorina citri]
MQPAWLGSVNLHNVSELAIHLHRILSSQVPYPQPSLSFLPSFILCPPKSRGPSQFSPPLPCFTSSTVTPRTPNLAAPVYLFILHPFLASPSKARSPSELPHLSRLLPLPPLLYALFTVSHFPSASQPPLDLPPTPPLSCLPQLLYVLPTSMLRLFAHFSPPYPSFLQPSNSPSLFTPFPSLNLPTTSHCPPFPTSSTV